MSSHNQPPSAQAWRRRARVVRPGAVSMSNQAAIDSSWSSGWMNSSERRPTISSTDQPRSSDTLGSTSTRTARPSLCERTTLAREPSGIGGVSGTSTVPPAPSSTSKTMRNTPSSSRASTKCMAVGWSWSRSRTSRVVSPSSRARSQASMTAARSDRSTRSVAARRPVWRWLSGSRSPLGNGTNRPSAPIAATTAPGCWRSSSAMSRPAAPSSIRFPTAVKVGAARTGRPAGATNTRSGGWASGRAPLVGKSVTDDHDLPGRHRPAAARRLRAAPPRARRLLLPDARLPVGGRRRGAGHPAQGVAVLRPVRGAVLAAVLALPHRAQRLHGHAPQPAAARPPDGDGTVDEGGRGGARRVAGGDAVRATRARRPGPGPRRRPGRRGHGSRVDPPRVRRCPAAPAGQAAVRPHPLRRAALAGGRRRRAARDLGRLGEQRAAAGPRHPRAAARRAARPAPGPGARGAARPLRRGLRALRHRGRRRADAGGRRAVHAAVGHVAAGSGRGRRVDARPGHRLQGLGAGPRRRERHRRLRRVQARRRRSPAPRGPSR